jgi:hypothetical protein
MSHIADRWQLKRFLQLLPVGEGCHFSRGWFNIDEIKAICSEKCRNYIGPNGPSAIRASRWFNQGPGQV